MITNFIVAIALSVVLIGINITYCMIIRKKVDGLITDVVTLRNQLSNIISNSEDEAEVHIRFINFMLTMKKYELTALIGQMQGMLEEYSKANNFEQCAVLNKQIDEITNILNNYNKQG